MIAADYPVTFGYGQTSPPYGTPQFPYHRGDDRAMPVNTAVVVNGVTIGYSGQSGMVTGPHLHVGRFVGGRDTNPYGQGFTLKQPVTVYDTGMDTINGNYVRLTDGDGVLWVYLHLVQNDLVTKGQVLQGEPMLNSGDIINIYSNLLGRQPDASGASYWLGKPFKDLLYAIFDGQEYKDHVAAIQAAPDKLTQIKQIVG